MGTEHEMSRRRAILGGLAVFAASVNGILAFQWLRRHDDPKRKLPGEPLVLPTIENIGNRMMFSMQFSPDGKKIAVVCGNLTKKNVYVANFPARKPTDYRIIAELDNCYRLDGLNWCHADPTLLSCTVTEIQCKRKLPGITSDQEWRKLFKSGDIQEKNFTAYLCVISEDGKKPSRVCSLKASSCEYGKAATAWASNDTIYCLNEARIKKCCIASKEVNTIYDATSDKQKTKIRKGLHGLAWNPESREFVTLEYVREGNASSLATVRFDSEGNNVRGDVAIPSVTDVKGFGFLTMDNVGKCFVAIADTLKQGPLDLFYGNLNSVEHKNIGMPTGELSAPVCLMPGTLVIAFLNQKVPFFETLDRQQLPTTDDFSCQVVSLT